MSHFDAVREMAGGMGAGEQAAGLLCPACKGGTSGEKSFSIKRDVSSASYTCHRASCGLKGCISMIAVALAQREYRKPKAYTEALVEVPQIIRDQLADRIASVDFMRHGIKWAPQYDGGRLALPIRTKYNTRVGFTFRSLKKDVKPKSVILLTDLAHPPMSWYKWYASKAMGGVGDDAPLVIVEDQMSAYKAANFCHSLALLGTNLSDDKLQEITRVKPKKVIIALDEDATATAAKLVAKLSGVIDSVILLPLKKDLKDMPLDEIKKELIV